MESAGDAERGHSAATGLCVDIDDLIRDLEDVGEPPPGNGFWQGAAEELRELLQVDRSPSCSHLPLELVEHVDLQLQRGQRGAGVPYRQMREILRVHKVQGLVERQSREHTTCGCFPVWWRRSAPVAPGMPDLRQCSHAKSPVGTASTEEILKSQAKKANIHRTLYDSEPKQDEKVRSRPSFKRAGSVGSHDSVGRTPSSASVGSTGSFGRKSSSGAAALTSHPISTPLDTFKNSMRISVSRSGRFHGDTGILDQTVVPLRTILEKPAVNPSTPAQRRAQHSFWGQASMPSPDSSGAAKREAEESSSHSKHSEDSASHTERSINSTRRRQSCPSELRASAPMKLRPPVTAEEVRQTQLRVEALQMQSRSDQNVGFGGFCASPYQGDRSGRGGPVKTVLIYSDSLKAGAVCGKPTNLECDASGRFNAGGDSSGRFSAGSDSSQRGTHAGYAMSPVMNIHIFSKVKSPLYIESQNSSIY